MRKTDRDRGVRETDSDRSEREGEGEEAERQLGRRPRSEGRARAT